MNHLYPFWIRNAERKAKWGYINRNGDVVVQPKFDYTAEFTENLAVAKDGDKWGYINSAAEWVIEPQFDSAQSFAQERATVEINEKHAVIDKNERIIVPLGTFDNIDTFSEGLARVCVGARGDSSNEHREGYIDLDGNVVIPPTFNSVGGFSGGLAIAANKKKKWGYIDKSGQFTIEPKFYHANAFFEDLALVRLEGRNSKYFFIDRAGNIMIPELDYEDVDDFSEGLAKVQGRDGFGYIDKSGTVVIGPSKRYSGAYPFSCERACVESLVLKGGSEPKPLIGFIDRAGNEVIPVQFRSCFNFVNDLCWISINWNQQGYIDKSGKFVWQADQ